ncbi:MAG: dienelactone hydrolase [Cytophagales bacterium]|nr:dienelactone hydrolase [Cytophagales bacterium]
MSTTLAQNRIDTIRADAPALAAYGAYGVGVRTIQVTNPNQIDVLKIDPKTPKPEALPRYDRTLTLEVWYPAQAGAGDKQGNTTLRALVRDGKTEVSLQGRAVRDAAPAASATPASSAGSVGAGFPLVIISHGFPGNRFLLSPIAENIASKGYVVASIDHADSTYDALSANSFSSTLVNRPLDQLFVLNAMAKLAQDSTSFLYGQVDTNRSAIVGYSMGGYGALISAGGGVTQKAVDSAEPPVTVPHGLLAMHLAGSAALRERFDKRIKTIVAFAPWGTIRGVFDAQSLASIQVPMLVVAGSVDDVSGYDSIRTSWQAATGVDRTLLTFENANHNAGAPMPPPLEAQAVDPKTGATMVNHYIDAVWDNVRMNNLSQHYVTAWLGKYLKSDAGMEAYFDPAAWKGFPPRTAKGLKIERLAAGK